MSAFTERPTTLSFPAPPARAPCLGTGEGASRTPVGMLRLGWIPPGSGKQVRVSPAAGPLLPPKAPSFRLQKNRSCFSPGCRSTLVQEKGVHHQMGGAHGPGACKVHGGGLFIGEGSTLRSILGGEAPSRSIVGQGEGSKQSSSCREGPRPDFGIAWLVSKQGAQGKEGRGVTPHEVHARGKGTLKAGGGDDRGLSVEESTDPPLGVQAYRGIAGRPSPAAPPARQAPGTC